MNRMLLYILSLISGALILFFGLKFVKFYSTKSKNDLNLLLDQGLQIVIDTINYSYLVIFIAFIFFLLSLALITKIILAQRRLNIWRNSLLLFLSLALVVIFGLQLLIVYPQQLDDMESARLEQEKNETNYLWDGFEATWPLLNKPVQPDSQ